MIRRVKIVGSLNLHNHLPRALDPNGLSIAFELT